MDEAKLQLLDIINDAILAALSNVHTIAIGKVTGISTDRKSLSVKPVINRIVDGKSKELPEFIQVPPVFLSGGASYLAMPITAGDYALLLITERCFDRWWTGQDNRPPAQMRMHDYSDGFALVGIKALVGAITIPTETTIKGVMRLGSEEPADFLALASLVAAEFAAIRADILTLKAATHAIATAVDGIIGGTPAIAPAFDTATLVVPGAPGEVASSFVKAD